MKAILFGYLILAMLVVGCSAYTPVKYYFLDMKD